MSIRNIFSSAVIQFLESRLAADGRSPTAPAITVAELIKILKQDDECDTPTGVPSEEIFAPVETEVKKKVKKVKKVKDPNAPKKAKSAYIFFGSAMRPQVKAEGVSGKDIMIKLGAMWKESTLDKSPYNEQAMADKIRYAAEMAAYVAPLVPMEGNI
jgi:hypothetical protein